MSVTDFSDIMETDTNEFDMLEFTVAGNHFGINLAKVLELMQARPVQEMPNSHPFIEGVFQPRGQLYTVMNLPRYLGLPESSDPEKDIFIITSFNKMNVAFHVHTVVGISKLSWEDITKPDTILYQGDGAIVTGVVKIDGKIISILDVEKVTFDISPETGIQMKDVQDLVKSPVGEISQAILVSEDSALLRKMIAEALAVSGYTHIIMTTNGREAWDILEQMKPHLNSQNPIDDICCIITDIEMPQMDGHHLTSLIKNDELLCQIPVVIFSSIIDDTNRRKGEQAGADAQLSKPEIANLVGIVTELVEESRRSRR